MGLSAGQCRGGVLPVGGNFCRDRHELPVFRAVQSAVKRISLSFLRWHGAC
jgi:hypothetical protein